MEHLGLETKFRPSRLAWKADEQLVARHLLVDDHRELHFGGNVLRQRDEGGPCNASGRPSMVGTTATTMAMGIRSSSRRSVRRSALDELPQEPNSTLSVFPTDCFAYHGRSPRAMELRTILPV